jgi:hypothetical protein
MKKLYLFIFFCMASMLSIGQTYFWESFDGGVMPPTGWTISGLPAQWSLSNSNNAGGVAPEAKFTYVSGTSTTRLISPMADLTGLTSVKFSFAYFYDFYASPAPKLGVATRSHSGTWNTVWEVTPTANMGPTVKDLIITNTDVGQSEFQVCVYLNGNMYNLDYVFFDNFLLFNPLNLDAGLVSLSGTPTYFSDPVQVKGTIMNLGATTISSLQVNWQRDGGTVYSTDFTGLSLATQQMYDFTCTDLLGAAIGAHELKVWINQVNGVVDDNQDNDTAVKTVHRVCYVVPRKPCFEEFTSSTCNPCATFNSSFVPWCNTHDSDITLIKYQMNWPGSGDPYYTAEGGVRKDYYGVGFVPDLYTNGEEIATEIPAVNIAYNNALARIGMMSIAASHTLSGHIITVDAAILPYTDFTNCRVHIIVMERITHNNATTNGETSFEHVMMKMIPDANGTTLDFTDRVPQSIHQVVDLTGTHVEEWTDLIVGVIVQDFATREIYQSAYSVENGVFNTEARLDNILVNSTGVTGFLPDQMTYTVALPGGTSTIPEIEGVPIDTNEIVIVVPGQTLPGTTTIDVFAENLTTHNLYTVNYQFAVGQNEQQAGAVSLYPNPSGGSIKIYGAPHSDISVYTANGTLVRTVSNFNGTSLNLSDLQKGVYILSIQRQDNTVVRKKIVLL